MEQLIPIIRFEVWLILGGLALIGAFKMLTGGHNMAGVLDDKATGGPSPQSAQSPVLAVMAAAIIREADDALELPTSRARAQTAGNRGERRANPRPAAAPARAGLS